VPLQRISQGFRDISLSFKRHPITNDINALSDVDAIKRAVQNLVRIQAGEVFFNRRIGTNISDSLFELMSGETEDLLKTEISTVIENYEPRVLLRAVDVTAMPEDNALDIAIRYDVVGLSVPTQAINFVLEPTRL
jgi:hypothetical protein|tara:strand:- start:23497 stop:23901 length:405 start_codon:yes stop_codon:yes gene_type:complete